MPISVRWSNCAGFAGIVLDRICSRGGAETRSGFAGGEVGDPTRVFRRRLLGVIGDDKSLKVVRLREGVHVCYIFNCHDPSVDLSMLIDSSHDIACTFLRIDHA